MPNRSPWKYFEFEKRKAAFQERGARRPRVLEWLLEHLNTLGDTSPPSMSSSKLQLGFNLVFNTVFSLLFGKKTQNPDVCLRRLFARRLSRVEHTETANILAAHMMFLSPRPTSSRGCAPCILCIPRGSPGFIDARAQTQMHTGCALLSGGLQGNRAERKLRAFAKQGLSGVMATGADYPTLHQSGRGGEERGMDGGHTQADEGVKTGDAHEMLVQHPKRLNPVLKKKKEKEIKGKSQ